MDSLHTLTLSRCEHLSRFMYALCPKPSRSEVVVCPKLEELTVIPYANRELFDIYSVMEMAATRASRGAKVRIVELVLGQDKLDPQDVLELKKHVTKP